MTMQDTIKVTFEAENGERIVELHENILFATLRGMKILNIEEIKAAKAAIDSAPPATTESTNGNIANGEWTYLGQSTIGNDEFSTYYGGIID